jgi:hypothetical protein
MLCIIQTPTRSEQSGTNKAPLTTVPAMTVRFLLSTIMMVRLGNSLIPRTELTPTVTPAIQHHFSEWIIHLTYIAWVILRQVIHNVVARQARQVSTILVVRRMCLAGIYHHLPEVGIYHCLSLVDILDRKVYR